MSMKNPLTPAGIQPATFRFVAQHLNHCATAVQILNYNLLIIVSNIQSHVEIKDLIMWKVCRIVLYYVAILEGRYDSLISYNFF